MTLLIIGEKDARIYVSVEGTWFFDCCVEANSKEEAIEQLMNDMDGESGSIDLYHTNQWIEDEEDTVKKRICVINIETGSIDPYHYWQDGEYHEAENRVKLTKEQVKELFKLEDEKGQPG